ncbi:AtzE family amidohydrolase [Synoicihabitans lomoniglobus]|uniref:AtzE family amidohydrolase n=1 Tax=Synoicihabitans lomoniglobus TaxID=2909285 RepID=A0AAF0I1N4_9BACT|nr:AtzE family amidohydrolase [Opitutaceae bacterium LMO-M01]WED65907.1 AtzE family amidohydrolase [Opitutaceae bacterium LMO-M01]
MSLDPVTATATEIAAAVRERRISARSVTDLLLERIAATHTELNAFTLVTAPRARAEADAVDATIAAGRDPGPLAGVPYAVKNLFDLAGEVTVAGSKINRDDPPASRDATAVARLQAAGAVCLGALNMGEYAYDFVTENIHDGATHNPRELSRSAGGSSGGSGAAVAGGLVPIALGTDTNGSIRVPASFCGIWGLRPTYGALSRAGSFPFVDALDTIGPFARSVADLAVAYDAMAGPDSRDAACTSVPLPLVSTQLGGGLDGLRIAQLGGYFASGGEATVHGAVATVAAALASDRVVELPEPGLARTAAFVITAAESGARHLDRLRQRAHDFDPNVRDRLLAGALLPAAWVDQAQRFRAWWRDQLRAIFAEVDVLIAPATPLCAPTLGQTTLTFHGQELPLRPNIGLFTQPISLVGLPILAAPVHPSGALPCAVQLIGAPFSEAKLLRVARALEKAGVCTAPVSTMFSSAAA